VRKLSERVPKRRRREKKTDYKQRLGLLKSGKPRLVVRKSLGNTKTQIIQWNKDGDTVLSHAEAKELKGYGWKGHTGNIPSAYLTGYLLGKRAEEVEECILDLGLHKNTKESRIYAAVKGLIDSGVDVPAGEEVIPSEDRIKGLHIEEYASQMDPDQKKEHFSNMIDNGLDPEKLSENFDKVLENIDEGE